MTPWNHVMPPVCPLHNQCPPRLLKIMGKLGNIPLIEIVFYDRILFVIHQYMYKDRHYVRGEDYLTTNPMWQQRRWIVTV